MFLSARVVCRIVWRENHRISVTNQIFFGRHPTSQIINTILATLYLGAFAGVFGILCYFALQQKASAFQASLVFLIFPLIAVSLESCIYGYGISTQSMLFIIPLVIGLFLTLFLRRVPVTNGHRDSSSQKANEIAEHAENSWKLEEKTFRFQLLM